MPFPESERVIYRKNPLDEVICQLRFPSILRIDTGLPAAFQERVRSQYPLFKENRTSSIGFPIDPQVLKHFGVEPVTGLAYEFVSADEKYVVTLTKDSLALTTHAYERWEGFWDRLAVPLQALLDEYSPAFFTRLGLRYRDVIRRSRLGLDNTPWSELIQPHLTCELGMPEIRDLVEEAVHRVLIRLPGDVGKVRLQHGLASDTDLREVCYFIDSDFFQEARTDTNNARQALNSLNRKAGHLFRWCITDRLHRAMEPQPIRD